MALSRGVLQVVACVTLLGACSRDTDEPARRKWVADETAKHSAYLREFLNGTGDVAFYDGWYPLESDSKTGGAWRWMDRRSITRLRTSADGGPRDMKVTVYGWTAHEHLGVRTAHMEFAVNGHVLDRFEPPETSFVHAIFVPKWLLESSEWVDFAITVANTATPRGDWRDLGFATTGIIWTRADAP